ncbi:TIGR04086 family membrane protein [Aciduricibacillus chroicocephali]|uniref:TIGR04086 family membrane protein n=1 Tax=Aciduricibacillus chroicocephali TaxID=3054939 RepID=A0ABY9KSD1_9BACI|nr:TIGR04086 family membrane protein [Bacillaceae bacterium 44XB]
MRNQLTALAYGWTASFTLILAASLLLAGLLRFTTFNEPTLSWATLATGILSLFVGGTMAGAKGKAKGWLMGAIVAIGFTLLSFLVQSLSVSSAVTGEQALHHLFYLLAAMFGGMIGVNVSGSGNKK